ncbi:MAG: helix-turn-helix transcriptional regulator [Gemmatimonadetes bacterium]|nr:helix-turn-helix transcriptional regulator [Gemmatimonadota bacterium]
MPDLGKALREEMSRVAGRELRSALNPLNDQIRSLEREVTALRSQIGGGQGTAAKSTGKPSGNAKAAAPTQTAIRITPASIKKHRKRLRLSQAQMGKLLGVSAITILNWEQGKSKPRAANREAIAELRGMGRKDAELTLAGLS